MMIKRIALIFIIICVGHKAMAQGDHIALGFGPSFVYGENAGQYSNFKFKMLPSFNLSYNKQFTDNIGLRSTVGAQMLNSGGYDVKNSVKVINWGNQDQAFDFKGMAYYADVMPVFITNPNALGMVTSVIQFYAGLGLGVMYVDKEQEVLKNGQLSNEGFIPGSPGDGILVEGEVIKSNETSVLPYIPFRTGLSTNLDGDWDYSLEFILITTSNKLDGNNFTNKLVKPDLLGQIQFTVKWYFNSK